MQVRNMDNPKTSISIEEMKETESRIAINAILDLLQSNGYIAKAKEILRKEKGESNAKL